MSTAARPAAPGGGPPDDGPAGAARRPRPARRAALVLATLLVLLALAAGWVAWRNVAGEPAVEPRGAAPPPPADAATVARGAYLARAGNCLGCHTRRGGAPGAGGRAVATPFGTVYSSNLTPDDETGLGRWSAPEFRRALQHGRSRDGRLLTPAFPYPNFTRLTREDADALYAWLMTRPAVREPNRPHELRFPYGTQAALAVWRALYFRAGPHEPDPARSAAWNRGSYLVNGPAHCFACHAARNFLGAAAGAGETGGNVVSVQRWYAPSLTDPREAGVADWPAEDVVALLKTGTSPRGSALGPMAEVVARGTQHLSLEDLHAMAEYLRSLSPTASDQGRARGADAAAVAPATDATAAGASEAGGSVAGMPGAPGPADVAARGARLYETHCAGCHGERGEGTPGIAPLAGNRAVRLADPRNVIQAIRHGGFLPTTAGNPRPFGMPPFGHVLGDDDIAAVATHVRQAWGNAAPAVSPLDVLRAR